MVYLMIALIALGALGLVGAICFRAGYQVGWHERHEDMILPENIIQRTNRHIDEQRIHSRHSAIDPKRGVWH